MFCLYDTTSAIPFFLVEQILLNTPALVVLTTCRHVCRAWKHLIETSPALKFYSTTGLHQESLRNLQATFAEPQITPLAVDIISCFWWKLAQEAAYVKARDIDEAAPAKDAARNFNGVWFAKPLAGSRRRVQERISTLAAQFEDTINRVPFALPEIPGQELSLRLKFTSNWNSIPWKLYRNNSYPADLDPAFDGIHNEYFEAVMRKLALVLYRCTPLYITASLPAVLSLELFYYRGTDDRLAGYDALVIDWREMFGLSYDAPSIRLGGDYDPSAYADGSHMY
ncbi:hypothetical protein DRE_00388 [Drechslerella stenobrocha 248]|uniref:F-box domain-containing protein n=1 Tax=Drechslerella stenobrocha 248 TaxID=1043628 RepID=W7IEG9_9PEZI|nr:hypothetical protein DRE_00388 [Drechslerella stenobrocha 248]